MEGIADGSREALTGSAGASAPEPSATGVPGEAPGVRATAPRTARSKVEVKGILQVGMIPGARAR